MADYNKKILITGAAGLIGRSLFAYLKSLNYNVVGIDNLSRFPNYKGECENIDVKTFVDNNKNDFDFIYHLAAINGTSNFYNRPLEVITNNTKTDLSVFDFAAKNKNCKLVYASTSEVVAGTNIIPTPEITDITISDVHNSRWSYRHSKILSENYLVNSDLNYVIIRFFNLFSEHSGPGHFVYDIIEKIKNKNFEIIGADETRSFCYVDDALPAIVTLGETQENKIFNVGSDEEISILEAAEIIANKFNEYPKWNCLPGKEGSVRRRCPNLSKLKLVIPDYNPRLFKEVIECMDI